MTNRIETRRHIFWLIAIILCTSVMGVLSILAQTPTYSQVGFIPGEANFVEVEGRYAYVVAGPELKIVDVSEPSAPKALGTYKFEIERIYGIAVSGSFVYVAADFIGLAILDVSNPATPALCGKIKTARQSISVVLAGTKALVADTKSGLEVIDISDPTHPVALGSYYTDGYCRHPAVSDGLAYVVDIPTGFSIVDITKPGSPREVSAQQSLDQPRIIAVTQAAQHSKIACSVGRPGIDIYDVSDPAAPMKVGSYKTPGRLRAVKFYGRLAYVADGPEGLQMIDFSTPSKPIIKASYKTPLPALDMAISGAFLFVATGPIAQAPPTPSPTTSPGVLIFRQTQ